MGEATLLSALGVFINDDDIRIRQLATLAKDLIDLAGDDPRIVRYINMKASMTLEGKNPWG